MRCFLILSVCLVSALSLAQRNTIFLELGGNGGLGSINYERQLGNKLGFTFRAGLGVTAFEFEKNIEQSAYCIFCGLPKISFTIPFSLQYLLDLKNDNYLETGLGSTLQFSNEMILSYQANIGFRKQFGQGKRWMWKVNVSTLIGVSGKNAVNDSEPLFWGGV